MVQEETGQAPSMPDWIEVNCLELGTAEFLTTGIAP
jgi:hypothetical protein